MNRKHLVTLVAATALATLTQPVSAQPYDRGGYGYDGYYGQNFDNIRTLGNGRTEIRVSRDCVTTYDGSGYRIRTSRGCSGNEITRSDNQYASYRASYDDRGFGRNRGFGGNRDNIRSFRNGETQITMSYDCTITYDATGYRIRSEPGCSGNDITRADRQYANYRGR